MPKINLHSFIALIAMIQFSSDLIAATPEEEQRILEITKKAFETNDTQSFLKLFYWSGVSDDIKDSISQATKLVVEGNKTSVSVSIVATPENSQNLEFVREGVTYHPNLPIIAQLKVVRVLGEGSTATAVFPIAEKDGQLVIPQMSPVK